MNSTFSKSRMKCNSGPAESIFRCMTIDSGCGVVVVAWKRSRSRSRNCNTKQEVKVKQQHTAP